jgi:hypothetical protein
LGNTIANVTSSFITANLARTHANIAYDTANTALALGSLAVTLESSANLAIVRANAAFDAANAAQSSASSALANDLVYNPLTEAAFARANLVWNVANTNANSIVNVTSALANTNSNVSDLTLVVANNSSNITSLQSTTSNLANSSIQNTGGTIVGTLTTSNIVVQNNATLTQVVESFTSIADANGVVTHDCSTGQIFNHTSIDANFTANFTNLNLGSGRATTITLVLNQGGTAYIANAVQIQASAQTIKWSANTVPTGNVNAVDVVSFSIFNNSGTYTVLGQLSTFG